MDEEENTYPIDGYGEFLNKYLIKDTNGVYTNQSYLVPVYRVKEAINYYFADGEKLGSWGYYPIVDCPFGDEAKYIF
uniref:Uncharacterized protein n=1 Tax=Siphoviridae sp. ctZHD14 TaxID=2827891 RepID=A0A8S5SXQ2_9CAUD|nr:MAG TPA: hypothetical protein [Siphoviridae sp. ctZHD14]